MFREYICPHCEQEFEPKDYRQTYCGYQCSARAREKAKRGGRPLPSKTCDHCGSTFQKSNEYSYATWDRMRFCSRQCARKGDKRRIKICRLCNARFRGLNGRKCQPYCSPSCYWKSLRTERYPVDRRKRRGVEFSHRQRTLILNRSGHRCERCGAAEKLEVDHVVPIWKNGTNKTTNGQVLCRSCHLEKTNHDVQSYWLEVRPT